MVVKTRTGLLVLLLVLGPAALALSESRGGREMHVTVAGDIAQSLVDAGTICLATAAVMSFEIRHRVPLGGLCHDSTLAVSLPSRANQYGVEGHHRSYRLTHKAERLVRLNGAGVFFDVATQKGETSHAVAGLSLSVQYDLTNGRTVRFVTLVPLGGVLMSRDTVRPFVRNQPGARPWNATERTTAGTRSVRAIVQLERQFDLAGRCRLSLGYELKCEDAPLQTNDRTIANALYTRLAFGTPQ